MAPSQKTGAPSPETRGLGCCSSSSLYATRKYSISQQPECGPARAGGFYLKIKSKVSLYRWLLVFFAARPFKFKLYYRLKALRLLRLNREPRGL